VGVCRFVTQGGGLGWEVGRGAEINGGGDFVDAAAPSISWRNGLNPGCQLAKLPVRA
jgi:hypothetical protein